MSPQVDSDEDATQFGTFRVKDAAPLPDVLDVLVAGGGPAGTAAAVRAKEFGLSCLVIDYDDLMKRIRDYPKEKLIKPNYGGADKMRFPSGGPLLEALQFDDIDKDEMVRRWKALYKQFGLNAKVGSELTGIKQQPDGLWDVKTWNHRRGTEVRYHARNVLIAIGAGVPRRFDIPGNTDGINFRLDDAAKYVGASILVIGGGTSAAEAVIAVSNAKIRAEDPSPVYWSYRGDRLPKVSRALSQAFFDAYAGNGNIRYLAFSEPVAVITGPDKTDYLSVRIDRKIVEGRPPETTHLEFPKRNVIACIGEDLPIGFLQQIGVRILQVDDQPTMLVNHHGEISLPGVFLIGDVRGPVYLRCTNFDDPSTYEQVTNRQRNIKLAMLDAVQAIEVIGERLGKSAVKISAPAAKVSVTPPVPSQPADALPARHAVQIVRLRSDGTPDQQFALERDQVRIGRAAVEISCANDVYMADHHATVAKRDDAYSLEDTDNGSGVWIRVRPRDGRDLVPNDTIWVGSQILVVSKDAGAWVVAHYNGEGAYQATFPVGEGGLIVGRGADAPLDPQDMSLSRRHAQFRVERGTLQVFDLGSRNGTCVKLTAPQPLSSGDEFRIASSRFRFESYAPIEKIGSKSIREAPAPSPAAEPSEAPASPGLPPGAIQVVLEHAETPVTFGVQPGADILHGYFDNLKARFPGCKLASTGEPAEHNFEPLGWECKDGLCGLCVVRIIDGAENFEPPDPSRGEMTTIAKVARLKADPMQHRLACVARIKGPVKITTVG